MKNSITYTRSRGILIDPKLAANEALRIAATKSIIAALPQSLPFIQAMLKKHRQKIDFEIHFTFFCFFDEVFNLDISEKARMSVLHVLQEYLLTVPRDTALAAWMIGDLLGAHWPVQQSLPILCDSLLRAKYVVGRKAAMTGIQEALEQRPFPKTLFPLVIGALTKASQSDRSPRLRCRASRILLACPCKLVQSLRESQHGRGA